MFRQYGLANWSRLKAFVGSVVLRHSDTARVRSCHWRQIAFPGLFASQHVPIASILNPAPHRDSGVCASTSSRPGCHQDGGGAKFITDPTRITADFRVVSRSTNASRHSFVTGPLFKLQLRRELFATGLIENPGNPCDLVQSRKLYEDYAIKSTHELHPDHASCRIYAKNIGRNMLASHPMGDHGLGFLYIPPVTSRKPIDTWSILPFPFTLLCFAVYHPENLLAIDERDGE